jgi:Secretion system C-terminal sorting domain
LGTYVTKNNRYYVFGVDEPGDADDDGTFDQTGLQLFCNTYTSGQTDIFRDSETLMRQDQGGNQPGNTNLRAGNRFSAPNCDGANSDFVVDPYNNFYTEYHCHDQANTIPDCGGTSDHPDIPPTNLLPVEVLDLVPYSDTDCPNTFGGPIIIGPNPGVISGLIGQLQSVREDLQDAKDTYLQVVDRNQKQSTLDILSEAFPHESQFYRDLLMQRYPQSDEVLKRLIMEASRLSSWHLTEVFLANSPLSKEILYKIDEANILTSFFMSFLYNADSGASLRRLMELNMLSLATERDQLIQSIARAGLTYETDAESEADQPINVNDYLAQLALQEGSTALRIRAAYLAAKGDYNSAIALIANEPLLFSYQTILQMEQSVSGDWSLLSESQISALWDIYNSKKDYSSSMALSILQQIGAADFEPEPRVPIQYRSLQIAKDDENVALPLLGVWPNPASNSAWLHYPIEADEHATIEVYDPQGRLLNSFQPNTNGLVELSLKSYESGIYVVQLRAFDKVVESIKLTVVNQD